MAEPEKVFRGLEACQVEEDGCTTLCKANGCPYNVSSTHCMTNLHKDALALLREQEPRVLTVEEIRSGAVEVAWIEDADKAEVIPGIWFRLSNEGEDEAVDIHIRDGFVGARLEVYGKLWRCWTVRPTEEQRKAVLWDG